MEVYKNFLSYLFISNVFTFIKSCVLYELSIRKRPMLGKRIKVASVY